MNARYSGSWSSSSASNPGVMLLVGVIFTILGIGGLIATTVLSMRYEGADSVRTGMAIGVVTDVPRFYSRNSTTCGIAYEYTVNGESYDGGSFGSSTAYCTFHVGQKLPVYYNPGNPYDSTTEAARGTSTFVSVIFWALAGVFAIAGVSSIVAWLRIRWQSVTRSAVQDAVDREPDHLPTGGTNTSE